MKRLSLMLGLLAAGGGLAEVVHVIEEQAVDGVVTRLSDTTRETGATYETRTAPAVPGYIFTYWSTTARQDFEARDPEGRAWDAAPYRLYEATTLTANYVPASLDTDGDGLADGYELYWYGSLAQGPSSDTDGDGYTFAQEVAAGTNPHFPDTSFNGGVVWSDSAERLYNPHGYAPYTVRSEPEGALFETTVTYAVPGTSVRTPACDRVTSAFAYWTMDGAPVRDEDGRAADDVAFTMPNRAVELVAVCAADPTDRAKLYWYGTTSVSLSSDTDGDGYTLEQELAAGTNPLFPDTAFNGGVVWRDSGLWQYNPHNYRTYVVRSEPEGALFASVTNIVTPGTLVTTGSYSPETSAFAHWTVNGVVQRDEDGRALDRVSLPMPDVDTEFVAVTMDDADLRRQDYWYGRAVAWDSDTDGDGYTFAQEMAAGTNPLFPDAAFTGGVVWSDAERREVNLQPYEQMQGALVDGGYTQLFHSPIAGNETAVSFGSAVTPVVADLNGDGLFDLVVLTASATNVFLNVGTPGNPEFERKKDCNLSAVDLQMNSPAKLSSLALDVPAADALSATTNGATLLVSDADGRIWYYTRGDGDVAPYQLQHKVWGGSYPGFANGLKLAAVDWEDDGDLDCLCGTADGRLMLLRNPKVGRPTNVKALAGVDNVLLTWDPNAQSRIRGYRVYRSSSSSGSSSSSSSKIAEPVLPTHRDTGLAAGGYAYEISSVSRFYTAGNSTPIVGESPRTAAVLAEVGGVTYFWNDVNATLDERVEVLLSVENAYHYDVAGRTLMATFDPAYLKPVKVAKTGLTEGVEFAESVSGGTWTVSFRSGVLPAGGGKVLGFIFDTLQAGTTQVGDATVTIAPRGGAAEVPPFSLGDVNGDGKIDLQDLRDLAKYKEGTDRKYDANNLKAGDFNGNGRLDNADYQALRELLREKGLF